MSAELVAATVTEPDGTAEGAVYNPEDETVPTVELPPLMPFTVHVTAVLDEPVTVAVNCCVPPARSDALMGVSATETPVVMVAIVTIA